MSTQSQTRPRRWTMHSVPFWARPVFWVYGYGVGFITLAGFLLFRLTCQIQIKNTEVLNDLPNAIFCLWHDRICGYIAAFILDSHKKQAWLHHPDAYMKPVHVVAQFMRIGQFVYGSTGRNGRSSAEELLEHLKSGYSTTMTPDGPAGPQYQFKKGAFHLAQQSNVPIVPMSIQITPSWNLPTWDRKIFPFPFVSKMVVTYGTPVYVRSEEFTDEMEQVRMGLDLPQK